jgi:hypothetical protein
MGNSGFSDKGKASPVEGFLVHWRLVHQHRAPTYTTILLTAPLGLIAKIGCVIQIHARVVFSSGQHHIGDIPPATNRREFTRGDGEVFVSRRMIGCGDNVWRVVKESRCN